MQTIIRLPEHIAIAILCHPNFQTLHCASRLCGEWVIRKSDGTRYFELYDPTPDDAEEFMRFGKEIATKLIETIQ